jgi:stage II sporulation protein AA (anti-sigma F factor antagonist)
MTECESIEIIYEKHVLKIKIRGDIDHHSAKGIRDKIDNEIFSKRPSMVVLDLSVVEFMDSSGLGLIMGRYANSKEIGANFLIYKPCKKVKKILELAGVERIMEIKGDDNNEEK